MGSEDVRRQVSNPWSLPLVSFPLSLSYSAVIKFESRSRRTCYLELISIIIYCLVLG
uniref:Uncharacterized protein n=1 Tax=Arundo donax TaxID=35708 RepID=A0A0A9BUD6_ARUDO